MPTNIESSLKLREKRYTGLEIMPKENTSLEEFLKNHFKFPSSNFYEIKGFIGKDPEMEKIIFDDIENFISEDKELEKIIYGLPEIVSKEFSESPISLDFTEYCLPDEDILEIMIKTPFDGVTTSHKKDLILDEIFTGYSKTTNEYHMSMMF